MMSGREGNSCLDLSSPDVLIFCGFVWRTSHYLVLGEVPFHLEKFGPSSKLSLVRSRQQFLMESHTKLVYLRWFAGVPQELHINKNVHKK